MRTLTIHRKKAFAGYAAAMKIYIEDPEICDLKINGVSCRRLGILKNGQQAGFPIGEAAARVYVVADKLTKNVCNEFYPIPAGTEDVSLSGKIQDNPFVGNPFYFDDVTDEEVLANRKKTKRSMGWILVAATLVGVAVGFISTSGLLDNTGPKTFLDDGLQITLTDEFRTANAEGFDVCFESRDVAVLCLKESFSLMEGIEDYTLQEYGEMVIESNYFDSSVTLQSEDDLTYFTYVSDASGELYYYYAVVYKSADAFWLVQFATPEDQMQEYQDLFVQWADSVRFEE